MKRLLVLLMLIAVPVQAEEVLKLYAGGNVSWPNSEALPMNYELGANARASLSEHLALVGAAYAGVKDPGYARASFGLRVTATDVNDPNFSIGVGIQRHVSNDGTVRPEEWMTDVSLGWRPMPERFSRVIVGAQAGYGLDTETTYGILALRFFLGGI